MSTLTILSRTLQRGFIASLAAASLLAGCATGPRYSPPAAPDVTSYTGPVTAGSATVPDAGSGTVSDPGSGTVSDDGSRTVSDGRQSVVMGSAPREDWWRELNSPQLDEVVTLALRNNLSLETARATLAAAQESAKAARGARNIQVDAGADVDADFLGPLANTFPTFSSYAVGPTVSYDFDLFGGTRHRIERADAMTAYNREQLRAARLEVASDTVTQALRIASLRAQIEVVTRVLDDDKRTLELVRAARRVGVVSDIDVLTATNQRDRDRALLPPLHQELDVARDALAILVGQPPAKWSAPQFALAQFNLPRELRLVLPSDLVRARPDIQAAEAELHAASAAVGVATANLYPRITLSSGWAESALMSGGPVAGWSLIGGITAPIFHGGALNAQRRAAQDDYQAAFAQYQLVVLRSFGQVADTLHALENDAEALQTDQTQLDSAERTVGLTQQGYRVGNAGILQVVTAQREQQLAEIGLVQARTQRVVDTVALYVAAGGGT